MPASARSLVRSPRRGGTLVETAIVLPLCLLFILGVFEYSRYLMMLHLCTNAACEGCRYATLNGMQQIGRMTDGMPSYKLVYGDQNTIVANLQQAIIKILESTVPVALVR